MVLITLEAVSAPLRWSAVRDTGMVVFCKSACPMRILEAIEESRDDRTVRLPPTPRRCLATSRGAFRFHERVPTLFIDRLPAGSHRYETFTSSTMSPAVRNHCKLSRRSDGGGADILMAAARQRTSLTEAPWEGIESKIHA